MATQDNGDAAGAKKVELSANESWLFSRAMMHHKTGIATSDIDWAAVLGEEGCPYGTEGSVKVTFNNLRRKLGLGGAAKANGGASGAGANGTSTPATKTRTPRKKKEEGAATTAKKTPTKVTKSTRAKKSGVNKEALTAAVENGQAKSEEEAASDEDMGVGEDGDGEVPVKKKALPKTTKARGKKSAVKKEASPAAVENDQVKSEEDSAVPEEEETAVSEDGNGEVSIKDEGLSNDPFE